MAGNLASLSANPESFQPFSFTDWGNTTYSAFSGYSGINIPTTVNFTGSWTHVNKFNRLDVILNIDQPGNLIFNQGLFSGINILSTTIAYAGGNIGLSYDFRLSTAWYELEYQPIASMTTFAITSKVSTL